MYIYNYVRKKINGQCNIEEKVNIILQNNNT